MSEQKNTSQKIDDVVSLGKSVGNIIKGASTGGLKGVAVATVKEAKGPIIAIISVLFIVPAIFILSLPSVIFNGLNNKSGLNNTGVLCSNFYTTAIGESERTEVYVIPKVNFEKWIKFYSI